MKNDWLFPHRCRQIGWFVFIPSALLGLFTLHGNSLLKNLGFQPVTLGDFMGSFADEIAALGAILGLLFIAFAREKSEDEMIRQLRLESLQWSVYINYFLLALAIIFMYDDAFFTVMIYNMFTVLLVFIIRFRWSLKRVDHTEEVIA